MKSIPCFLALSAVLISATTSNSYALQTAVNLRTAGDYAILTKAGIDTTAGTTIVGDIGVSPIAATGITGFGLIYAPNAPFSTSSMVTGQVFASDYGNPTPANLTTAIGDMETAYADAAGRSNPDVLNLGSGSLSNLTPALAPGLYKWASGVTITNSLTFDGGGDSTSIWVLQIDNILQLATGAQILLSGGALAQNIFWQSVEGATLGTNSHFEGILLTAANIAVQTDASLNGNLYAQTAVTLDSNGIVGLVPEPSTGLLVAGTMMAFSAAARRRAGVAAPK